MYKNRILIVSTQLILLTMIMVYCPNFLYDSDLTHNSGQETLRSIVPHSRKPSFSMTGVTDYIERGTIDVTNNNDFGPSGYDFPGYGNETHPYLIDGYNITDGTDILINIQFTTAYFKISNCLLDGVSQGDTGIRLVNVENGIIVSNNIVNCSDGIYIWTSNNIMVSGNTIHDCKDYGVTTWNFSNNNTIKLNEIYNCPFSGIFLSSSSYTNLLGNNISAIDNYGILVDHSNYNNLSGNTIYNCSDYGVIITSSDNNSIMENNIYNIEFLDGIYLQTAYNNSITNNTVCNITSGTGIALSESNNTFLSLNTIYYCSTYGIFLISSNTNIFSINTIYNCTEDGIYTWNSSYNKFFRNTIYFSELSDGIWLDSSSNHNTLSTNTIYECTAGIYLSSSNNNSISNNNIYNNSNYGLYIIGSSQNNEAYWNNFLNNRTGTTPQAYDSGTNNNISNNFWDDQIGNDTEPDDVFDTPYSLAGGSNEDPFPSTKAIVPTINVLSPYEQVYGTDIITVEFQGNAIHYWYFIEGIDSINHTWITGEDRILPIDATYHLHVYGNDSLNNIAKVSVTFTTDFNPPIILITSPTNTTFTERDVWVNFTINKATSWIGYSLDDTTNVTITENFTLSLLPDGSHSIVIWATDLGGNNGSSNTIWFSIDSILPFITISSPINTTYTYQDVWLNFTSDEPTAWIGYSLDGAANITITDNVLMSSISEGSHWVIIYANDTAGNMGFSTTIWFTVDSIAPEITINSPVNSSYVEDIIWINFTISEPTVWVGYSLDGMNNVTINDNVSIGTLLDGVHTVIIYASDSAGNIGKSTVILFTKESTSSTTTITSSTTTNPSTTIDTSTSETTTINTVTSTTTSKTGSYPGIFTILLLLTVVVTLIRRKDIV